MYLRITSVAFGHYDWNTDNNGLKSACFTCIIYHGKLEPEIVEFAYYRVV